MGSLSQLHQTHAPNAQVTSDILDNFARSRAAATALERVYGLLTESERVVLCRLSIFAGVSTMTAAACPSQQIATGSHGSRSSPTTLPALRADIHNPDQNGSAEETLTGREQHILQWISRGLSNKEIARVLGIGPETVKTHINHIFLKLDVRKRAQAAMVAQERGLLTSQVLEAERLTDSTRD